MVGRGKSKNLHDRDGRLLSPTLAKWLSAAIEINMGDKRKTHKKST